MLESLVKTFFVPMLLPLNGYISLPPYRLIDDANNSLVDDTDTYLVYQ